MSEHIQECPSSNTCDCNMGPVHKDSCPQRKKCICNELRAYGERLVAEEDKMIPLIRRNEYERGYNQAEYDLRLRIPDAYDGGYRDGSEAGYKDGLNAIDDLHNKLKHFKNLVSYIEQRVDNT